MLMQFKLLNTYVNALGRKRLAATLEGTVLPQATQDAPLRPAGRVYVNLDQWDGYQAERRGLARKIKAEDVKNFVTITGDLHTYLAGYLKEDFDDPLGEPIGTCFMAGSVTSSSLVELATRVGIPAPTAEDLSAFFKASNPHLEFFNSSTHGYNVLEVTLEQLTCTMWAVNTIRFPEATLYPLRRFTVSVNEALIVQSPV